MALCRSGVTVSNPASICSASHPRRFKPGNEWCPKRNGVIQQSRIGQERPWSSPEKKYSRRDFFVDKKNGLSIVTYRLVGILMTDGNEGMPKRRIRFDSADSKHRQRILKISEVAAELFGTKGYLETSIDDIADAARVTKGGVYYYFRSKAEILYFICSTYVDSDLENLEQSLKRIDESTEKIRFIIFRHIEHYSMYEYSAKTLLNESYCLPTRYFKQVKSREREYL